MLQVSLQSDGRPEIFFSIQGEGINCGVPAVFLRLALCNLKCSWCDTKYTWDWEHYSFHREAKAMETEDVEAEIVKFPCKHLVLTGGEPTLQQRGLVPLLHSLKERGYFIEIETNGTLIPSNNLLSLIDQWNVSPKLANSENRKSRREKPLAYNFFAELPNAWFKYVIDELKDLEEVNQLRARYGVRSERIMLMPQATDAVTLKQKSAWLVELCKEHGYRFSSRVHVMLWGTERGT